MLSNYFSDMLLHRFPVCLTPEIATAEANKTMSIIVSLYRKNVDNSYRQLICKQIAEGKLDDYVGMMIVNVVNQGKNMGDQSILVAGPVKSKDFYWKWAIMNSFIKLNWI